MTSINSRFRSVDTRPLCTSFRSIVFDFFHFFGWFFEVDLTYVSFILLTNIKCGLWHRMQGCVKF
uniref:Uncharacterized protein MANES_04G035400 n=1 Tax=Rhizophora mucronata TaxID=61149 RepID=A0A2P2K277_RHIMU